MFKCICGKEFETRLGRGSHRASCSQYKDYLEALLTDTEFRTDLSKYPLVRVAQKYDMRTAELRYILNKVGLSRRAQRKPVSENLSLVEQAPPRFNRQEPEPKIVYREPTAEQVQDAIFLALQELKAKREENVALKVSIESLAEENKKLIAKAESAQAELKALRDKFNRAFALEIDARASQQVMENR